MSNTVYDNSLNAEYLQQQLMLARNEINNLRQQLTALNHVHRKECDNIYKKLEEWQCTKCRNKQINHCDDDMGATSTLNQNVIDFQSRYIGTIRTNFPEKRGTPRQPGICHDMIAKIVLDNNIFTNPNHALEGLQEYSHMWILFHFHKNDTTHTRAKVAPPRLNGIRTGVFATRSPHRPTPIGLSLVKIDRIMDNTIYFSGVDMVDQTPVLDIKPYIPQYDNPGFCDSSSQDFVDGQEPIVIQPPLLFGTHDNVADLEHLRENLNNLSVREMDGEENERREFALGAVAIESTYTGAEEPLYTRSHSRMGEREAPDGEEEESASSNNLPPSNTSNDLVRVPSWINDPNVASLSVIFKNRALFQLSQLGPEGEEKKNAIMNVLREDPRSTYLRQRWGNHCYVFRIAELYVSCQFNDSTKTVTVYRIFQNEGMGEADD